MKFIPRQVPWYSPAEWLAVYSLLYSNDRNSQILGVNRVKSWGSRGKVPHAIEATSVLIEVGLQDDPTRLSTCSQREISYLLAMSIIRFVNGIIDAGQKGNIAGSANTIAEQVGLPLWFVELRHSATHDKLPSLQALRNAKHQALEWLDDNYWKIEAHSLKDISKIVDGLLDAYMEDRLFQMKSIENRKPLHKMQKAIASIVSTLSFSNYPEILLPLLMKRLLANFNIEGFSNHENGQLEFHDQQSIVELWEPLFSSLEKTWQGFSEVLFLELMHVIEDSSNVFNELAVCWAKFIIKKYLSPWDNNEIEQTLMNCLNKPNAQSLEILDFMKSLAEIPPNFQSLVEFATQNVKLQTMRCSDHFEMDIDLDLKLIEKDLKERKEYFESQMRSNQNENCEGEFTETGWSIVEEWSSCPIGMIPGGDVIELDLDPLFDDMGWLNEHGYLKIPYNGAPMEDEINLQSEMKRAPIQIF